MNSTIQDRIAQRLGDLGLSAREASLRAGKGPDLIRRILDRPNSNPRGDSLRGLAGALATTEQWLLTGGEQPVQPADAASKPAAQEGERALTRTVDDDSLGLPIMGTAAGSFAGAFEIDGKVIGFVERPPALRSVPKAYAVYVTGSSMDPEPRHGDLRFIDPSRPPRPGETVVVQVQNERNAPIEGYIGHLARQQSETVTIRKLNPAAEVSFNRGVVLSVHRVMTINDMYGR